MTNHIEEMMRTAGVEPQYFYNVMLQDTIKPEERFPLRSCTKGEVISYCRDKKYYGYCKVNKVIKTYPDFTAEKQLEIIKLLFGGTYDFNGFFGSDNKYHLHLKSLMAFNQDFTQALAQLTTELMKAGELDKEKVKGILEG